MNHEDRTPGSSPGLSFHHFQELWFLTVQWLVQDKFISFKIIYNYPVAPTVRWYFMWTSILYFSTSSSTFCKSVSIKLIFPLKSNKINFVKMLCQIYLSSSLFLPPNIQFCSWNKYSNYQLFLVNLLFLDKSKPTCKYYWYHCLKSFELKTLKKELTCYEKSHGKSYYKCEDKHQAGREKRFLRVEICNWGHFVNVSFSDIILNFEDNLLIKQKLIFVIIDLSQKLIFFIRMMFLENMSLSEIYKSHSEVR